MRKLVLVLALTLGFISCDKEAGEMPTPQCERCMVAWDPAIQGYRCYITVEDCAEGEESNIPN